jgi:PTH2 family peptidyl-tRNA hydrolase
MMDEIKQVIVVRKDLKLPKGKLSVQVAHACVDCVFDSIRNSKKTKIVENWRNEGMKKSVLYTDNLDLLLELYNSMKREGFVLSLIKDAGKTVVEPGTITCFGIGPDYSVLIDKYTSNLKLV